MTFPQWEQIPDDLRVVPKWCIGAPDKSPYTLSGKHASVTDPVTWTDWYSASTIAAQWGADIGFVLGEEDEFACIDLDVKEGTSAEQLERYWKIIQAFDSYAEFSRSGKGVHIWVRGKIGMGARRDGVEVYSQQRFIICTGNALPGFDKPIAERQELLELLVDDIRRGSAAKQIELIEADQLESDEVIWKRAREASNADKFIQLCNGDWAGQEYPSQSEADLSLLSMLCFYSRSNEQVRRMFRATKLGQRAKAVKNDKYLDRTLATIRGRQEVEDQRVEVGKKAAVEIVNKLSEIQRVPHVIKSLPLISNELSWPPGMVGELAKWFYSISPRPVREVSIVSALGVVAGVYGRAFNINGSGLNLYIVLVARSGIGKEAMHSSISKLIHIMLNTAPAFSEFVDFSDFASGPALVKSISSKTSFVNVAGEWGRKLRKMSDDHSEGPMSSLRTVMTNLYQKSSAGTIVGGIGYSDKDKDIKSVNGVAYSMIGETTPETFYESLTNTMMQDGFMSRFIVVEHTGKRPDLNPSTDAPIPQNVYSALINSAERALSCPPNAFWDVAMSSDAKDMMDDFDTHCTKEINGTEDESWRQMWNRGHLKALKVAGLLAVADNPMTPIVTQQHADWALQLINRDICIMGKKITEGDVGSGDAVRERKMLTTLAEYLRQPITPGYQLNDDMRKNGVVARKYLQIRLQKTNCFVKHHLGQSAALDMTLRSLIDSGYLTDLSKEKLPADWNFTGKCYRIVSLPD